METPISPAPKKRKPRKKKESVMATTSPAAKEGFKFDKTINIAHVITLLGFIAAGISIWQTIDKRVVILEEARTVQAATDRRQDAAMSEYKKDVRENLNEINRKLDKLLDRMMDKK